MSRVEASVSVPGGVAEAEALWYDTGRWAAFVDGFSQVLERGPSWPQEGVLVWESKPHGRGRVRERVTRYELHGGQSARIEEDKLSGTQTVAFESGEDSTRVTLTLEYALKDRNAFTPLVDFFFVRRALRESLRRTLTRFANERRGDALGA